ncbi:hypothetical protein [Flavobacterium foetidum]|uniref:hypothetical protein n=1 Tax=Flavobacterium foetidum TaxID=2026681 RepID=UPI00107541C7|nr:hypothetical protein [Flavobacterium foetidum]KAF2511200.1 hypothetical protein E0W73_16775 [Flavobacterium foetidum]
MKENDKNLESLIEKMMADVELDSAPIDFTSKIMSEVSILENKKAQIYKPLIPKVAWVFIFFGLSALIAYVSLFSGSDSNMEVGKLYVDKISGLFSAVHFSKNVLYSILIVPIMILIQVGLLKNYFDKKYEV